MFKEKKYTINSLSQIKIPDPFNKEDEIDVNNNIYDLGYTDQRIKMWNKGLQMIYIPKKIVMFKMMLASKGIRWPEDLWFKNKK